jgi:hypothetical protein
MNHGEIKCCGSPIYLKNNFGAGFRIRIIKSSLFDENKLIDTLNSSMNSNGFNIETNVADEICILLGFDRVKELPDLLSQLNTKKDEIGVHTYSISSSNIEEVFLK